MPPELIPPFDFHRVVVAPWTTDLALFGWVVAMGFLVATACGLVGNYLMLRRMVLVGDAISHSVLPGLVIAYLLTRGRSTGAMFAGALVAALATTVLIETIHKNTRVKQDAAIGIVFSSLFALGVILISVFAGQVDLDQDCVLNGELALIPLHPPVTIGGWTLGPPGVVRMGAVAVGTAVLVAVFYKELLVSSFDPGLATSIGIRAGIIHHALMGWLAVVVVSAFEAVGAILVIAMLVLPGATASLLTSRLPVRLAGTVVHAALSSVLGLHLAVWLECSIAGAMVVMGMVLFGIAWIAAPGTGLIARARRRHHPPPPEEASAAEPAPLRP